MTAYQTLTQFQQRPKNLKIISNVEKQVTDPICEALNSLANTIDFG